MEDLNRELLHELRKLRHLTVWLSIFLSVLLIAALATPFWFSLRQNPPAASVPVQATVSASTSAAFVIPEKSVAVLPFDSLGGGEEVSHFADAVQEQILTNLAQNANLKIVARATVMPYRDSPLPIVILGRQLGVAHLVMGSVQRAANRVRVTVQLMDARTGDSVWAETFDRELNDVLAIESELAKTVTDQLGTKLAAR